MTINAADILSVTKSVTKKWEKQRKAEERGRRSRSERQYVYSDRVNFTDVAHKILPDAYEHASGGGRYPVAKRQFYYAARQAFKDKTGRDITANYFSQQLLVQYMNRHRETRSWRVVADPRGKLTIPNAGHAVRVPIGTLAIDQHLQSAAEPAARIRDIDATLPTEYPRLTAGIRYRDLLYIEKEGFDPLFEQKRIAERFNLAIASGKGQSTAAMRHLADMTCAVGSGCRLLGLHDFDKAGFQIAKRLTTNGEWAYAQDLVKYEFRHRIEYVDLGLRLEDVQKFDLFRHEEDSCKHNGNCTCFKCAPLDPDEYEITDAEYKYLKTGKRVEINALTSPQLVELLEDKLEAAGCDKPLIPADDVLADAYRRAMVVASINHQIESIFDDVVEQYGDMQVPKTLREMVAKAIRDSEKESTPWDAALYGMALAKVRDADAE